MNECMILWEEYLILYSFKRNMLAYQVDVALIFTCKLYQ